MSTDDSDDQGEAAESDPRSRTVSPDDPTRTRLPTLEDAGAPISSLLQPRERAPASSQFRDPLRYEKQGEHGRGGIGRVFRARDQELGRDVALKELLARTARGEQRFFREAFITARLEHPGIVPVHEAGRWPDGTPFYAMKLVAGRSLKQLISERSTIEERLALLRNVAAVADAIAYAHDRQIIHRDLKPSNIIVGDFGETVVIDWGLAKVLGEIDDLDVAGTSTPSSDPGLTVAGSVIGTPAYMAPEQARGEAVDRRADVYAIGMIMYDLCTGGPGARTSDRSLATTVDPDLLAIIARATEVEPSRRYPDAKALAQDLHAFLGGRRVESRTYNLAELASHWARHNRRLLATAVVVLALVSGVAGWSLNAARRDRERARSSQTREAAALASAHAGNERAALAEAAAMRERDPTAAIAAMQGAADTVPEALLIARALGAGVATYSSPPLPRRLIGITTTPDLSLVTFVTEARQAFDLDPRNGTITPRATVPSETPAATAAPLSRDASASVRRGAWEASGHHDGRVIVRDTEKGTEWSLRAHAGAVRFLALDPASARVLSATGDEIRLWNLSPPAVGQRGRAPCAPVAMVRHPQQANILAGTCADGSILIVDVGRASAEAIGRLAGASTTPTWRGDAVCAGAVDGSVLCVDRATRTIDVVARAPAAIRALASDGARLFYAAADGGLYSHAAGSAPTRIVQLDREPEDLSIATPTELVATTRTGMVIFVDTTDGKVHSEVAHQDVPSAVVTSGPGDVLIASWDGSVSRWHQRTFRARHVLGGPARDVRGIGDGFVASVGATKLRVESTQLSLELELGVAANAMASSAEYAAVATAAGELLLIDVAGRRLASVPFGDAVTALAALDEQRFAAAVSTGAIVVVDGSRAAWVEVPVTP